MQDDNVQDYFVYTTLNLFQTVPV